MWFLIYLFFSIVNGVSSYMCYDVGDTEIALLFLFFSGYFFACSIQEGIKGYVKKESKSSNNTDNEPKRPCDFDDKKQKQIKEHVINNFIDIEELKQFIKDESNELRKLSYQSNDVIRLKNDLEAQKILTFNSQKSECEYAEKCDKSEAEISRLNDRIEGMAKDNLNLLNSKQMLRKQNRIYKNEIVELKKRISKLESELNLVI